MIQVNLTGHLPMSEPHVVYLLDQGPNNSVQDKGKLFCI